MVIVLFASNALFYIGGANPNWFQGAIAFWAIVFLFLLIWSVSGETLKDGVEVQP
jgi:hypothetical protein